MATPEREGLKKKKKASERWWLRSERGVEITRRGWKFTGDEGSASWICYLRERHTTRQEREMRK